MKKSNWNPITNGAILWFRFGPSHLDPSDSVIWDISPGAFGRDGYLPLNMEEARSYYVFEEGGITEGSNGLGHAVNPTTQEPYAPQPVVTGRFHSRFS